MECAPPGGSFHWELPKEETLLPVGDGSPGIISAEKEIIMKEEPLITRRRIISDLIRMG